LYGGTVLLAATRGAVQPDESVLRILAAEDALSITQPAVLASLQCAADRHSDALRSWLETESEAGRTVFAYGAASQAVALFSRAGIDSRLLAAVADASPAKQGRRMPGTDIPIVSPNELLTAEPDRVLLTLPDLLPEVSARFPELAGRWTVDGLLPELIARRDDKGEYKQAAVDEAGIPTEFGPPAGEALGRGRRRGASRNGDAHPSRRSFNN
jgi:hypothetical protein